MNSVRLYLPKTRYMSSAPMTKPGHRTSDHVRDEYFCSLIIYIQIISLIQKFSAAYFAPC